MRRRACRAYETDLAEIILQLGDGEPSHIVVPALHVNRSQVREIFARKMGLPESVGRSEGSDGGGAAIICGKKFLEVPTAISGANFLIAETGGVAIVESEGNGRMCLTLPQTLITLAGIEKVLPRFEDLEVMLQVLARSATGERMNPYTSLWTGVTPGDGPQNFHVVLLDNGRSRDSGAEDGAADAALHSLRGLHEYLPGVPADGRACVWVGVSGADWGDPDAAVACRCSMRSRCLCVVAVRRVLRSLPGEDQYSRDPDRSARAGYGPGTAERPGSFSIPCTWECAWRI